MSQSCETESCGNWVEKEGQCTSCKEFGKPGALWRDVLTEIEERMGYGNPSSNLASKIRQLVFDWHVKNRAQTKDKYSWCGKCILPTCQPTAQCEHGPVVYSQDDPRNIDPEDLRKPMDI